MTESVSTSERDKDDVLLQRIRDRDEHAMELLFLRHSRLVYSVALRVLRDPHLAEDLLQDMFMQLWQKPINAAPRGGNISAFLAVMTRNRCIDRIRRQRNTVEVDSLQLASTFNLVEQSEQRMLLASVRVEMTHLPGEQRSALEMAFFEGLTYAEVAEKTGVPLGTIKTRIRTALQKLSARSNA